MGRPRVHFTSYACGKCKVSFIQRSALRKHDCKRYQKLSSCRVILERNVKICPRCDKGYIGTHTCAAASAELYSHFRPGKIEITVRQPGKKATQWSWDCTYITVNNPANRVKGFADCPYCPRQFNRLSLLRRHLKIEHGRRSQEGYSCKGCRKFFLSVIGMGDHACAQTGIWEHVLILKGTVCKICDKPFSNGHSCSMRLRPNHSKGEKRYVIDEGQRKGALADWLMEAFFTVYREGSDEYYPIECRLCHSAFSTVRVMFHHLMVFHNVRIIGTRCIDCAKHFMGPAGVVAHRCVALTDVKLKDLDPWTLVY